MSCTVKCFASHSVRERGIVRDVENVEQCPTENVEGKIRILFLFEFFFFFLTNTIGSKAYCNR